MHLDLMRDKRKAMPKVHGTVASLRENTVPLP